MCVERPKRSDDWFFPPDMAAVLAPIWVTIATIYITSAVSWAKAFGDTSLFHLALWLGAIGSATLLLACLPRYRRGRFFTMGPQDLSGWHRKLYFVAYALIVPSFVLLGLLVLKLK
jgi:hypothetical protein